MSLVSGQTQSLSPGARVLHSASGKGLSDADDRVSLPDLDDPDLYGGLGATSFLPDLGLGLADAVSSTHSVGFGSVLDLKWKPRAQTERRPSRKSLAYFKKSQIFKPSLHSLK